MAIHFRGITDLPLRDFTASAPDRAIIGIIGVKGSGTGKLLRIAAALDQPAAGTVEGPPRRRLIQVGEPLNLTPVDVLVLDACLSCQDALVRERACLSLERLRRNGGTILMVSHDQPLLTRLCDEVWWLDTGRLAAQGDPRTVLPQYGRFVTDQLVQWGRSLSEPVDFRWRRGDRRAEITALETLGPDGEPAVLMRGGQRAGVRVEVRFAEPIDNPVIGIMIRTRVGLDVFGTNTELEQVCIGRCEAGDRVRVEFRFECLLAPGEYTLTAASHDPDGTSHDWLDDAVAFSVASELRTAGVVGLRSAVSAQKL